MNHFVYEALPGRVVFGDGAIDGVADELDTLDARTVLLIASGSSNHIADALADRLGGRVVGRIDHVNPHVPGEDVEAALDLASEVDLEGVITIGGGSAIGLGKHLTLSNQPWSGDEVHHIAIPTTYSGSEMTPIYGMTVNGVKVSLRSPNAKPQVVIYDPELSRMLPTGITAGSAMNAMAHCVEALYAEHRNPVISSMAIDGISVLRSGLRRVVAASTDPIGRASLLMGAFLAGTAVGSVGMAIHHRICHVLGGTFGLSHGDANAVILPHVVAANARAEPKVMERVAQALDVADAAAGLYELALEAGARTRLVDLSLQESDLDRVTEMVIANPFYNPRPVEPGWIRSLLGDAFVGKKPSTIP